MSQLSLCILALRGGELTLTFCADLEWLLTIDKTNAPAHGDKAMVRAMLNQAGSMDWPEDHLVRSKRDEHIAVEGVTH